MVACRCAHCGEVVGVYEPARLLLPDGTHYSGSPLTLEDRLPLPGATVLHERCFEAFVRGLHENRTASSGG